MTFRPLAGACNCDCHNPMANLVVHHLVPCCYPPPAGADTPRPARDEESTACAIWLRDLADAFEEGRLPKYHASARLRQSADIIDGLRAALDRSETARTEAEQDADRLAGRVALLRSVVLSGERADAVIAEVTEVLAAHRVAVAGRVAP